MSGRKKVSKKGLVVTAVILGLGLVSYLVVVPTAIAKRYLAGSDRELTAVTNSLNEVAASIQLPLFNDPDISLQQRQKQLDEISAKIEDARGGLDSLEQSSELLSLPGSGITGSYRAAVVRQEQSQSIVSQSRQVMAEYTGLLSYLKSYTDLQAKLDSSLSNFNNVQDFDALKGRGGVMYKEASVISGYETALRSLPTPAGFTELHDQALQTFNSVKQGYNQLAMGLNDFSDQQIYQAVDSLEQLTVKNQIYDKNTLVDAADESPILQKVAELPEKTEHARGL